MSFDSTIRKFALTKHMHELPRLLSGRTMFFGGVGIQLRGNWEEESLI